MVTFSHLPYSLGWEEGQAQDRLFERILAIPNIEESYETPEVEEVFKDWLRTKERTEQLFEKPSQAGEL